MSQIHVITGAQSWYWSTVKWSVCLDYSRATSRHPGHQVFVLRRRRRRNRRRWTQRTTWLHSGWSAPLAQMSSHRRSLSHRSGHVVCT